MRSVRSTLDERAPAAYLGGMTVLKNIRHEKFAQLVASGHTAGAAYRTAYERNDDQPGPSDTMAMRLLKDSVIFERIKDLRQAAGERAEWTVTDALRDFLDISEAPVNELIATRIGACRFCYGDNHQYQWKEREYLEACQRTEQADPPEPLPDIAGGFGYRRTAQPCPSCPECEGEGVMRVVPQDTTKLSPAAARIYEGVKKTRDGYEIKIADRHKARENAARIIGAFVDRKELSGPKGEPLKLDLSALSEDQLRTLASIAVNG